MPIQDNKNNMKSIIITGATNGIGLHCALELARTIKDQEIILTYRNNDTAKRVLEHIQVETDHPNIVMAPLLLDSLESVAAFVRDFAQRSNRTISTLINNAGIQRFDTSKLTNDGFEETIGVNHLAPTLLTLLLSKFMDRGTSITFTTSALHDTDKFKSTDVVSPADLSNWVSATAPAASRGEAGLRQYSISKLLNVMTVYQLQSRLMARGIRVNAFNPGMVPGTGILKDFSSIHQFVWNRLYPLFRPFNQNINTPEIAGKRLAQLSTSKAFHGAHGIYFNGITPAKSATDSYDTRLQEKVWEMTVAVTGVLQHECAIDLR